MHDIPEMVYLSLFGVNTPESLEFDLDIAKIRVQYLVDQTVRTLEFPFLWSLLSWTPHTCFVCCEEFLAWGTDRPRMIAERWQRACTVGTGKHDWMWKILSFPLELALKPDFAGLDFFNLCTNCLEDSLGHQVDSDEILIKSEDDKPRLQFVMDVPEPDGSSQPDQRIIPQLDDEDIRLYATLDTLER